PLSRGLGARFAAAGFDAGTLREQCGGERRFALVKAVGMKGFLEREELVVEVVAKLVDQRAQKRLEGDDLTPLRRAHPGGDARPRAPLGRLVEPVQLAVFFRRAPVQDTHAHRRHAIACIQLVDQTLACALHRVAVVGGQRRLDAPHGSAKLELLRNAERHDAFALAIDSLARGREAIVVGKTHRSVGGGRTDWTLPRSAGRSDGCTLFFFGRRKLCSSSPDCAISAVLPCAGYCLRSRPRWSDRSFSSTISDRWISHPVRAPMSDRIRTSDSPP